MEKKNIILIVVIALILIVAFFIFRERGYTPTTEDVGNANSPAPGEVPPTYANQVPSAEFETGQNVEITYTDSGFTPASVTVKPGRVVTFKNFSSQDLWPASGPHPAHDGYPVTGGCRASLFDACRGLKPGQSWSFQFDVKGTWNYHNHLVPFHTGKVIVK